MFLTILIFVSLKCAAGLHYWKIIFIEMEEVVYIENEL